MCAQGTNLNPDGIFLGLHRTNAKGYNLNRMWSRASLDTSPELVGIQKAMLKYGVDFNLDVHCKWVRTPPCVSEAAEPGHGVASTRHA